MMKQFVCTSLSILFFHFPSAAQTGGWNLTRLTDASTVEYADVKLLSLDENVLKYRHKSAEREIPIDSIVTLSLPKGGDKTLLRAFAGAFGLGATGYLLGRAIDKAGTGGSAHYSSSSLPSELSAKMYLPIVGAVIGAALGASLAPKQQGIEINLFRLTHEERVAVIRSVLDGKMQTLVANTDQSAPVQRDVVYLKNGSTIRGAVIEILPDSIVKIKTPDSSLFVFPMSDVEKTRNERVTQIQVREWTSMSASRTVLETFGDRNVSFSLAVGVGAPIGDYADDVDAGVGFRGELNIPFEELVAWTGSVSVSVNRSRVAASSADRGVVTTAFASTGLRIGNPSEGAVSPFLHGEIGLLVGFLPQVENIMSSSSATSVAFGAGCGLDIDGRVCVAINYLKGEPKFTFDSMSGGASYVGFRKLTVSLILVSVGVVF